MISLRGTTENAYNNPSSWSVTLPEAPDDGDVAVVWTYTYNYSKNITVPASFVQLRNQGASNRGRLCIAYRVLHRDDISFTFTSTNSYTDSTLIYVCAVFRGVDEEHPIDAESGLPVAGSGSPNPPACTSVTNGAVHFGGYGQRNDTATVTPPTNYTLLEYCSSTLGLDAHVGIVYRYMPVAGTDDPGVVVTGITAGWMAHTLALRPAALGQAHIVERTPLIYQPTGLYLQGEGDANYLEHPSAVYQPTGLNLGAGDANYVNRTPTVYQGTGVRGARASFVQRTPQAFQPWGRRFTYLSANFVERTPAVYASTGDEGYNSYLTDLDPGTHYYVRAYATTIAGTGYGEAKEFNTSGSAVAAANFVDHPATIYPATGSAHIVQAAFVEHAPVVYQPNAGGQKFAGLMGMLFNARLRGVEQQSGVANLVTRTPAVYLPSGSPAAASYVERTPVVYQPDAAGTGDNIVIEKNIDAGGWNVVYIGPWDDPNPWVDPGPFTNGVEYCYRAYRVTNGVASPYSNTDCVTYASSGLGSANYVVSTPTVYGPSGILGVVLGSTYVVLRQPVFFRPTGVGGVVNGYANYVSHPSACYEATGLEGLKGAAANYVERSATVYEADGVSHHAQRHGPPFKKERNTMTPSVQVSMAESNKVRMENGKIIDMDRDDDPQRSVTRE